VRIAHVCLHAAQTEHDAPVAFTREVLRGVERLVQGDAEAALQEHREVLLAPRNLEELEVLGVAGADLEHDPGWIAGLDQGVPDLVDVGLVGHLHRDHLDAILARQLEHVRQARLAVPLEGIRTGARLVGPHARADLPVFSERPHHLFDVLGRVHSAKACEHVQGVLPETHAAIVEVGGAGLILVATEDAVLLGHAHDALDAG
jgi:hypothetical protein